MSFDDVANIAIVPDLNWEAEFYMTIKQMSRVKHTVKYPSTVIARYLQEYGWVS